MNQHFKNSELIPNKSTIHLTETQFKYAAALAEGKTRGEAVKAAGYSGAPAQIEKSDNLRRALILALDKKGLTTDRLAEKIAAGTEAQKTYFSSFKGEIVEERQVPDNETQHKYVRTALEVRGDLVKENEKFNVNVGIIEMPGKVRDVDGWNEVESANVDGK